MNDENEQEDRNRDVEMLKRHCHQLAEHFETVQIFCTRHMPAEHDGTISVRYGEGNWFARYGGVREWIIVEESEMRRKKPSD